MWICHSIGCSSEVEGIADKPRTADHAQQLLTKLKAYDEGINGLQSYGGFYA